MAQSLTHQIKVDQLGYRPDSIKYVIFGDAVSGQNSNDPYVPGGSFTIRRASDDVQVWPSDNGTLPMVEQHKAADGSSQDVASYGEIVFVGDFSAFTTPGTYYVYDTVRNVRSPKFKIGADVYDQTLVHAQRMFFYNRANVAISSAHGGNWTHALAHEQMGSAEFYDTQARGDAKDLRGGWYDAGDYNKYVTFVPDVLWALLEAVEAHPAAFGDANNIPESGNGRKDLLDEAKVELDWLLKMQETRSGHANFGGFYNILGSANGYASADGDPALDTNPYYYSSVTTWATAAGAVSLAKGAQAFANVDAPYAQTLRTAAERAWTYLEGTPAMFPADGWDTSRSPNGDLGYIGAGDSRGLKGADKRFRVWAAAELFRLTGTEKYHTYFKDNHASVEASSDYDGPGDTNPDFHPWLADNGAGIIEHSRCAELNFAYATYVLTDRAGKDSAIVEKIKSMFRRSGEAGVDMANWDAYRFATEWSHFYWGSNASRSRMAMWMLLSVRMGVNQQAGARFTDARFREVAEETLHYIHGRNALGYMYLSNMGPKGANLVDGRTPVEMYHHWFAMGTKYDGVSGTNLGPPPGFLVGGPAKYTYDYPGSWSPTGLATSLNPPGGQPQDKSYLDFNDVWINDTVGNVGSYVVNEPGIYYQAPYIYVLSAFAGTAAVPPVSHGVTVTWPSSIPSGGAFDITVTVTGTGTRNLIANLANASGTSVANSSAVTVNAAGTYTLSFTNLPAISSSTAAIWVGLFDSTWSTTLVDAYKDGISVTSTPPPPVVTTVTLDVENLTGGTTSITSGSYIFRGIASAGAAERIDVFGTAQGYSSKVLHPRNNASRITLERVDGTAFTLKSFGYAEGRYGRNGDMIVTATKADGTTITTAQLAFTVKTLTTVTLPETWTNLTRVTFNWAGTGSTSTTYGAIDNIVVQ